MREVDDMAGVQVPLAVSGGIAVGAAVALALHVSVETDAEVIVAPRPIPRGQDVPHMAD